MKPNKAAIAQVIDHTYLNLGPTMGDEEKAVEKLVQEAVEYGAYGVCIRSHWVAYCRRLLSHTQADLKIVTVVGFPLGDEITTEHVVSECHKAKAAGADEFDMVAKVGALKRGNRELFMDDIKAISAAVGPDVLKIIFENAYLTGNEKPLAYELARQALATGFGGDSKITNRFFKTSTGFAIVRPGMPSGATLEDVKLMHEIAGPNIGIKAAGGVKDYNDAVEFWQAAGAPEKSAGVLDPRRFRIGSSSLLMKLSS